jgi:hypothetical protein
LALISLLFFLSGISGLIYQVVWVREFGNVFGNTVYSASLIIAVFMLGLGAGSYLVGAWADRQYAARPESLLRTYGVFEIVIGAAGLAISAFLPHLGSVSVMASSYSRDANGWYALSVSSYAVRVGIAALLLTPITLLMGGTLTLLIRFCVRLNNEIGAWRIALLYGVNTAGAAAGAFLTDFMLVPALGLQATQWIAVLCNVAVGVGAFLLASRRLPGLPYEGVAAQSTVVHLENTAQRAGEGSPGLLWASLALALSGFAAMGMEILWFRHFTVMLGGFRAVFSLLLTVILIGIGVGSLAGGWLNRVVARPVQWLMVGEGLFVAATVFGLANADVRGVLTSESYVAGPALITRRCLGVAAGRERIVADHAPDAGRGRVPALVMGLTFPLANAVVEQAERGVGRRAGVLYFSNTLGAVCGSLAAGFLLLPSLGMQASATLLLVAAALTVIPLTLAMGSGLDSIGANRRRSIGAPLATAALSGLAIALWLRLPANYVIAHAQIPPGEDEKAADAGRRHQRGRVDRGDGPFGTAADDQRSRDVVDDALESALYAGAGSHPAAGHRSSRDRAGDRFRRRQHHARDHAASHDSSSRDRRPVAADSAPRQLLRQRQSRRAHRSPRRRVRRRRAAASADARRRTLRPDRAGAAADCAGRRRRVVLARVLRAGARADCRRRATSASGCPPIRCLRTPRWR